MKSCGCGLSWLGRQALKVMGSNPSSTPIYAGMTELADALDLGSSVITGGSSPLSCTIVTMAVVKKVEFLGSTLLRSNRFPGTLSMRSRGYGVLLRSTTRFRSPDAKRRRESGFGQKQRG